jgi:hypothetical protein
MLIAAKEERCARTTGRVLSDSRTSAVNEATKSTHNGVNVFETGIRLSDVPEKSTAAVTQCRLQQCTALGRSVLLRYLVIRVNINYI